MTETTEEYRERTSCGLSNSYDKLHKHREPGFITSAISERTPGGLGLALPSWTIVPLHYHSPHPDNYSRYVHSPSLDQQTNLITIEDSQGRPTWKVENSEGILQKHQATMWEIQAKLTEAFTAMKNDLDFWRAVQCLESARSSLWSCHKNSSLDFTIGTHMGHAILRAALLQNPDVHKQQVRTLLLRSVEEFESTRKGIDRAVSNNCTNSLRFSCIIGMGWIHFFQGNTIFAMKYLDEAVAQIDCLDKGHFRGGDRDFDSIFLKWAVFKAQGKVEELKSLLDKIGHRLTDPEEERFLVALLETEMLATEGLFFASVQGTCSTYFKENHLQVESTDPLKEPVYRFMEQLQAGYAGNSWLLVGASREAERSYETAKKSGSLLLEAAAQVGLGNVYMRRGRAKKSKDSVESGYDSAASFYQQALATYDEIGCTEGQSIVYCNMGILHHKQNRLEEARSWYKKALNWNTQSFQSNFQISRLFFESKNWERAEKYLGRAKECASNPSIQHLQGAICLARMLDDRRQMTPELKMQEGATAADHFKEAISSYSESQRDLRTLHPIWLTIFEQQKDVYEELVWCIASTPVPTPALEYDRRIQALVWSERSRSRLLMFEEWHSFFESLKEFLTVEDSTAFQALKLTAFDSSDEKNSWKSMEFLLERSQLPDTLILEYHICTDFGILIMVIKIGTGIVDMVQIPFTTASSTNPELTRQSLNDMVTKLISNLGQSKQNTDSDDGETLKHLYKILLEPVEKHMNDAKQLIIVPHEVLFNVPFHALIDGEQRFFIQRMPLSFAESLRSLLRCWSIEQKHESLRQKHGRVRKTLVVGINEHKYHRRLAEAQTEAQNIASILTSKFGYREGTTLMGNNATKERLSASLSEDVDIIHIASHGLVNEYFEDGAIVCSHASPFQNNSGGDSRDSEPQGAPALLDLDFERSAEEEEFSEDSLLPNLRSRFSSTDDEKVDRRYDEIALRAEDLQELHLRAQLAIFSACQTAQGVILGEGVAGLGRALLRAGVRCTILSQWQVSDRETSALMKDIYDELAKGLSVSTAMQKAMVKVITRDEERCEFSVKKWAPFVPLGLSFLPISKPQEVQQQPMLSMTTITSLHCILLIGILSFIIFYCLSFM